MELSVSIEWYGSLTLVGSIMTWIIMKLSILANCFQKTDEGNEKSDTMIVLFLWRKLCEQNVILKAKKYLWFQTKMESGGCVILIPSVIHKYLQLCSKCIIEIIQPSKYSFYKTEIYMDVQGNSRKNFYFTLKKAHSIRKKVKQQHCLD